MVAGAAIWICRKLNAVQALRAEPGAVWDGRWLLIGPLNGECLHIGALGRDGLSQLPNWRDTGRPQAALVSSPVVWNKRELVAAPLAG